MRTLSLLLFLWCTLLTSCSKTFHKVDTSTKFVEMGEQATDSSVTAMIAPYKQELDAVMNEVIGTLDTELRKSKPESTLGNFIGDLLMTKVVDYDDQPIDFAVSNYGGLRIPFLSVGKVTRGQIFELMPFDNLLVVVEMDGETAREFIQHMAQGGGWPMSKQVRYTIKDKVAENITIHGKPLTNDMKFRVLVSDYIANGGDKCTFLMNLTRKDLGVLFRDAIIQFIIDETKAGRTINAELDNRVIVN